MASGPPDVANRGVGRPPLVYLGAILLGVFLQNRWAQGPIASAANPIYLGFSLIHLGIAFWLSSPWLLLTLLGAAGFMSLVVIPREERYLEGDFRLNICLTNLPCVAGCRSRARLRAP